VNSVLRFQFFTLQKHVQESGVSCWTAKLME